MEQYQPQDSPLYAHNKSHGYVYGPNVAVEVMLRRIQRVTRV
jgi:hypothetical protein